MLYLPYTKIVDSSDVAVAPGAVILAEGQALVRKPGATLGVQVSAGEAGEIFAGFSIAGVSAAPFAEGFDAKVEKFIVPASGKVTLQFTPAAGQFCAFDNTAGAKDADATATGKEIAGLSAGHEVTVTYRYAMTVEQKRAKYGDVQPGGYAGAQVNQIGSAKRGTIYTYEFDASVDWSKATAVKLAANGQVTDQSGSGVEIPAVVVALPGTDIPALGLEFSAL